MFTNKVKHNINVLSATMELGIVDQSDGALIVGEESCGLWLGTTKVGEQASVPDDVLRGRTSSNVLGLSC